MTSRCDWFGRKICPLGLGRLLDRTTSLCSRNGAIASNCLILSGALFLKHKGTLDLLSDRATATEMGAAVTC